MQRKYLSCTSYLQLKIHIDKISVMQEQSLSLSTKKLYFYE